MISKNELGEEEWRNAVEVGGLVECLRNQFLNRTFFKWVVFFHVF